MAANIQLERLRLCSKSLHASGRWSIREGPGLPDPRLSFSASCPLPLLSLSMYLHSAVRIIFARRRISTFPLRTTHKHFLCWRSLLLVSLCGPVLRCATQRYVGYVFLSPCLLLPIWSRNETLRIVDAPSFFSERRQCFDATLFVVR